GAGVLFPHAYTAIACGVALLALGLALNLTRSETWTLLARVCITVGALMACGGIGYLTGPTALSVVLLAVALGAVALLARSGLLAAIAVTWLRLSLSSAFGEADTFWAKGSPRPTVTIIIFAVLALGLLF